MSKKPLTISLIISIILTVTIPIIGFGLSDSNVVNGFPLQWTSFNLLGSETNYLNLLIDIVFWFFILFAFWKLFSKLMGKKA